MSCLDDTLVDETLVGVPLPTTPARIPRVGAARRRPTRRRADVLLLVALVALAAGSGPLLVEGAPMVPVIRVLTSNAVVVP